MRDFSQLFSSFLNTVNTIQSERNKSDQLAYERKARQRAFLIQEQYLDREASGQLGDARLGNLRDAAIAQMLNQEGLFLGALNGKMLFHNGDGHHLCYGRAGSGKGITSVQPNLAHNRQSMVIIDVKDGELHYSSANHRRKGLGHTLIVLDPWNTRGLQGFRVNPLQRLGDITKRGDLIEEEALEIVHMLIPKGKADDGDNGWSIQGARSLLELRLKYLAYFARDRLTLSELWRLVNCSDEALTAIFDEMIACSREDVSGPAAAMKSIYLEAEKQFEAYRGACIHAVSSFSPGSKLAKATETNEVDFGLMKHKPITVYLCVPSSKLGVAAPWIALVLNHAIEQIAAETGPNPVRFLIDEFAQLPAPIPAVMKVMRLYRGRGILLSMYCQGRFSLRDAGYSEAALKEIEDQAACMQMWGVEDPSLIRDVELWSGNTSVVQVNPSHSGGTVASGSMGRTEVRRHVLQSEDIRRINDGWQIIKMPGFPLFVAQRVPYFSVTPWKSQLRDVRDLHFGRDR